MVTRSLPFFTPHSLTLLRLRVGGSSPSGGTQRRNCYLVSKVLCLLFLLGGGERKAVCVAGGAMRGDACGNKKERFHPWGWGRSFFMLLFVHQECTQVCHLPGSRKKRTNGLEWWPNIDLS